MYLDLPILVHMSHDKNKKTLNILIRMALKTAFFKSNVQQEMRRFNSG